MTDRQKRYEEILDNLHPEDVDSLPDPTTLSRYLLVEGCTLVSNDGSCWITTHDTPEEAGEYHNGQEYPGDWDRMTLYDLDTGDSTDEYLQTTTFVFSLSDLEIQKADAELALADRIVTALGYDGHDVDRYGIAKTQVLRVLRGEV